MSNPVHPLLFDIERIERHAWKDLLRVFPPALGQAIGLQTLEIHHALFLMANRIPQYQFNWLHGAGLEGDEGQSIAPAVQRFRAGQQRKFFIQIAPGPHALACADQAREQGLVEHPLAWAKFVRSTAKPPAADSPFEIREAGIEDADLFAATAIGGFGMPAPMAAWLVEIVTRPKWHTYIAYYEGTPAGAAALYVDGDFAWLGIGATLPAMRKRGGQSSMIARRIADAARYGAKYAVTETGVPQAGQPAPSYTNIRKAGFEVAYDRANWAEPA